MDAAAEVAAMQFAGGMSVADVAAMWERSEAWVEAAVRDALLARISVREGGTKPTRVEVQAQRRLEAGEDVAQPGLFGGA